MTRGFNVDTIGVWVPRRARGSFDVYFDDRHVWSFKSDRVRPAADAGGAPVARWPRTMVGWLEGVTEVRVVNGTKDVFAAEVRFSDSNDRVNMVDGNGVPVMVDKWGLLQRPFDGRGENIVGQITDLTATIIEILDTELGLKTWLAFGSLLGAARNGHVIGHDSDVDLAYLSHAETMVGCIREMYDVTRVLRAAGLTVLNKSGGFVTVLFTGADGSNDSIDVYSYFYVGENLYGNATLRAPAPPSVVEPCGELVFEGATLPVPADVSAMLELSYGPGWRVPDPSFQHEPSLATKERFDGWMGSLMPQRRDWERWSRAHRRHVAEPDASAFATWALEGLEPGVAILDLGAGTGRDAVTAARRGHRVSAVDYARGTFERARKVATAEGLPVTFDQMNLRSWRDTATAVAEMVHRDAPGVVLVGGVLDSVSAEARQNVYRALALVLGARGGEARLEFAHEIGPRKLDATSGGVRKPVPAAEVERAVYGLGGEVVSAANAAGEGATEGMTLTRMTVRWAGRG